MQFEGAESKYDALAEMRVGRDRNQRCFQDRRARKALRQEQRLAAEAYLAEDDDAARKVKAAAITERRARARAEGAKKARRRARNRRKTGADGSRRTRSQGDCTFSSENHRSGPEAVLTSEERVTLASWDLQHKLIADAEKQLELKAKRRSNERARREAALAAAPTRVANPSLFRLNLAAPLEADLLEPDELTSLQAHTEFAKARTKAVIELRPKKVAHMPLSRILDNEVRKAPINWELTGEKVRGTSPITKPPKKTATNKSLFGPLDAGGPLAGDAAPPARPTIRLPRLPCAAK